MITKTLGILLILLPLVFIAIMWNEGGLMAIGLYMLYLFTVRRSINE